jgi:hypothetical protein
LQDGPREDTETPPDPAPIPEIPRAEQKVESTPEAGIDGDVEQGDSNSEDSDEEESNELVTLIAIAQNIFDHPPTSDEGEEDPQPGFEGDAVEANQTHDEYAERPRSPAGPFIFAGRLLTLPSVGGEDSLAYRIEALRQFIEDGLGLERFIEVYEFVRDGSSELSGADADARIRSLLPSPELIKYYALVQQLVVCEEATGGR